MKYDDELIKDDISDLQEKNIDTTNNYNDSFSNDLAYAFYSVKKNEDADPAIVEYSQNEEEYVLLTVADGLGGSGAEKVFLDEKSFSLYKDAISKTHNTNNCFKTEFDNVTSEASYFNLLMEDISPNNSYTNALLASRIVIYNYINYVINNNVDFKSDEDKQKIVDYIKNIIDDVKEKLDIQKKIEKFSILPTTLVSIRYNKNTKMVDVVWAGDSRAYILTKNGLFQLSKDNEDSSGFMTNNFSYDRKNIKLYSYSFNKDELFPEDDKFIFLCASDGFFDPFPQDFLYDEYLLLKYIEESEALADSYKKMKLYLEENHFSDDITLAFYPIGFDSYDDIKEVFKERYEFILNIYKSSEENSKYISYLNSEEIDSLEYVDDRVRSNPHKFIDFISNNPEKFDELFEIGDILKDKNAPYEANILSNPLIYGIDYINDYLIDPAKFGIIEDGNTYYSLNESIKEEINILNNQLEDFNKKVLEFDEIINGFKLFFKNHNIGDDLSEIMIKDKDDDEIDLLVNKLNQSKFVKDKELVKKSYFRSINIFIDEINNLHKKVERGIDKYENVYYYAKLYGLVTSLIVLINKGKNKIIESYEFEIANKKQELDENEASYFEFVKNTVIRASKENQLDQIFKLDLIGVKPINDRIKDMLNKIDEDTFVKEIISFIGKNEALDQLFNRTSLEEYRAYLDYKDNNKEEAVKALLNNLNDLKDNYLKYLFK